jgi:hypothetical protein
MKEDRIFNEILDSIKNLRSIVKRRKWELIQDLIVGKPAIQKELNRVEKSIGKSIPEDFRKLLKYSKHLEFCYQYDEKMPTKFRENFSGEINWDLDKIVSLTKLYEEWLDASLDPEYNDEHAIAITEKVGKNRFPFMSISNGDFIVMGDSPSEIIYLSHEGGRCTERNSEKIYGIFLNFTVRLGLQVQRIGNFNPFMTSRKIK